VEIGDVLGVTTSRICQLHGRAVARLRAELERTAPTARKHVESADDPGDADRPSTDP